MSKFAVVDGDTVTFDSSFGLATLIPPLTTTISGTGKKLVSGAKVCVVGDVKSVTLSGVQYTASPYTMPGTGTLTIQSLAGDQEAQKLSVNKTAVILVGSKFNATFSVDSANPAKTPPPYPPPVQKDATSSYSGTGTFTTSNKKLDSA